MVSAIDPNFITTDPVSKAGMRTQLQTAADEISALQTSVAAKLATTGGTLTGDLLISKANPLLQIRKSASGQFAAIVSYNGSTARWGLVFGNTTAESGSSVGSDFQLDRYTDAGSNAGTVFTVARNSGILTFTGTPLAPTATGGDNSTKLATTAFLRGEFTGSNQTLSNPGFQRLPGTLQFKFGNASISGGSGNVVFSSAYGTSVVSVVLTLLTNSTPAVSILAAGNVSTTGFTVRSQDTSALSFSWLAIGW